MSLYWIFDILHRDAVRGNVALLSECLATFTRDYRRGIGLCILFSSSAAHVTSGAFLSCGCNLFWRGRDEVRGGREFDDRASNNFLCNVSWSKRNAILICLNPKQLIDQSKTALNVRYEIYATVSNKRVGECGEKLNFPIIVGSSCKVKMDRKSWSMEGAILGILKL